jgi:branched-chain amino acid transport system ATP-binding protein
MLAIGRALMAKPRLLLLDEPSMGLAPLVVEEIFRHIVLLREQVGISILLVEQNVCGAILVADRGYVLENGCITIHGTSRELRDNPDVQRAYLGRE